jgi:hypothetical protein
MSPQQIVPQNLLSMGTLRIPPSDSHSLREQPSVQITEYADMEPHASSHIPMEASENVNDQLQKERDPPL